MPHRDRSFQGKPNLVTLFQEGGLYDYPLDVKEYRESYKDFFKHAEKYFSIFLVRGLRRYRGNGVFAGGYFFHEKKIVPYRKPIAACVVYDKDVIGSWHPVVRGGWTVINHPSLARIMHYKDETYQKYAEYMKRSFRVRNRRECTWALKKIHTSYVVFKPVDGSSGVGVIIELKNNILKKLHSHDGIMMEYIDSADGIVGLVRGYHDLRLTIMDGSIVQVMVRVPAPDSLLANVAQGGTAYQFAPRAAPESARRIAYKIDKGLRRYGHRIYSVDFMYEQGTPYLVELNARPGLPFKAWGTVYGRWHRGLLGVLRAAARDVGAV